MVVLSVFVSRVDNLVSMVGVIRPLSAIPGMSPGPASLGEKGGRCAGSDEEHEAKVPMKSQANRRMGGLSSVWFIRFTHSTREGHDFRSQKLKAISHTGSFQQPLAIFGIGHQGSGQHIGKLCRRFLGGRDLL